MVKVNYATRFFFSCVLSLSFWHATKSAAEEVEKNAQLYATLQSNYMQSHPNFNNEPRTNAADIHFVNDTKSPIHLLVSFGNEYHSYSLLPSTSKLSYPEGGRSEGNEITLKSENRLLPLIGIKAESMLTGSRWFSAGLIEKIGALAYGDYQPYDLSEIIPQEQTESLLLFTRSGIGFTLDARPLPEEDDKHEENYEDFTRLLQTKIRDGQLYLVNKSPYYMKVTFNPGELPEIMLDGSAKTYEIEKRIGPNERISLQDVDLVSPHILLQTISRFSPESPVPAWLTSTLYKPIRQTLATLAIEPFDNERALSALDKAAYSNATFDLVIPQRGWSLHYEPVKVPALFQYPD